MQKNLIALALSLLDDDYGISDESYKILQKLVEDSGLCMNDVDLNIDACDGRYYIPQ